MGIGQWITQTHPTYDTLEQSWRLLQDAYRGAGGYLDGSYLVAHPREVIYKVDADGNVAGAVQGYRDSYLRRKALARYENFARTITDTFIAHLFAKSVVRQAEGQDALEAWWQDVDGAGTNIGDWLLQQQTLAMVYGHVVVLMDQRPTVTGEPARTRAEQGPPVLRLYSPLDVLDWIWAEGRYRALKVIEARPRAALDDPWAQTDGQDTRGGADGAPKDQTYVVWTDTGWTRYDSMGSPMAEGEHGFGRVPAVIHRARQIPGMPFVGASALGDPHLHKDHFNMVSEARAIERGQTFSMLNIQLGQDEGVQEARGRLGDKASVETILWTKAPAAFIAPPDGPLAAYQRDLETLERKLYRMAGLPWEGDAAGAESADSRRLKAMDLNRLLAMYADEAERVEYQLADLWALATGAATADTLKDFRETVTIHWPDEFATVDIAQAAADVRDVVTMQLGQTATAEARKRAVPIVLPDVQAELVDTIEKEIDALTAKAADPQQQASAFRARVAGAAVVPPVAGMAGGEQDGAQMQDAGARV